VKSLLLFFVAIPAFAQVHSATLSWNHADPAATFSIYKASGPCSSSPAFAKIASGITVKTYQDLAVATGAYAYVATATVAGAESVYSNCADALVPAFAPTGLSAGPVANGAVPLTWADPQVGATWSVYRSPSACNQTPTWAKLVGGLTTRAYSDSTVPMGSSCYGVTATLNGVESPISSSVTVTRSAAAPTGLTVQVQ
jgi:hypothetical protein